METTSDFCVVGAGPAGLTLALLLLRSGVSVTLVERSSGFDREFRGEILQPGGLALLGCLGVLDGARERGAYELSRFQLVEQGRVLLDIDYRELDGPYNHLLSVPQRHVLAELLDRCRRYDAFEYLEGSRVAELVWDGGQVAGVVAKRASGRHLVRAHCVAGADGRYSKVRRLAGLEYDRLDVFDHDVLWFKLPAGGREPEGVRVFRAQGSPVLVHRSYPERLQIGWTLPHRGYPEVSARGVDHVKAQVARAIPEYADLIDAEVTSLSQLTLLDVFAGSARRWVTDGLVLIGDSAHTHGPLGAQGVNLAIQDAAAVHPILLESLRRKDASAAFLAAFPAARRPDIDRVMKFQVMQSRAMLSQSRAATVIRPKLAALLKRTPAYRKVTDRIAFGNRAIRVRSDLFAAEAAGKGQPCA